MMPRALCCIALIAIAAACVSAQTFPTPTARNGYSINDFHTGLAMPTGLGIDPAGRVYVTEYAGKIWVLEDTTLDGVADFAQLFWDGTGVLTPPCVDVTWHNNKLYVADMGSIFIVEDVNADLVADTHTQIISGLPLGLHQNNQIVFDDAGQMYFGLGSTVDLGTEADPWSATVMTCDDMGNNLQVYATGLRNIYGLFFTQWGLLVGGDNAHNVATINPVPFDECNVIEPGKDYGFPNYDGFPPAGSGTADPALTLGSHAGPTGGDGDHARVLSGFENDAYMSFVASGAGAVTRISLFEHPTIPSKYDGFVEIMGSDFTNAIDIKVLAEGALLVCDFQTGTLSRIKADDDARIKIDNGPFIGIEMQVDIVTNDPNNFCLVCFSDSDTPAAPLPDGRFFHMDITSEVFSYSIFRDTNGNNIVNHFGQFGSAIDFTDASGLCEGEIYIPYVPSIVGSVLYLGAIGGDAQQNITFVTATLPFEILNQ